MKQYDRAGIQALANLRGFDPYDALRTSRLPKSFLGSASSRRILIQVRKRLPVEIGPLLGIEPFLMAKTVACYLTASSRAACVADDDSRLKLLARYLLECEHLARHASGGWGYEFDVQTRWGYYPADEPNTIVTCFVARAFGGAHECMHDRETELAFEAACLFLRDSMLRDGVFRYTLKTQRVIHNANLLAAGMVAAYGAIQGRTAYTSIALEAAMHSLEAQDKRGNWPYGDTAQLGWSDNFHTAYCLDGLLMLWLATGNSAVRDAISVGVVWWQTQFFTPSGAPKYFANRRYPYDIHAAATAIDVGSRLSSWGFGDPDLSESVYQWTRQHLIDPDSGRTFYQYWGLFTDRRSFARWGEAHWVLAQTSLGLVRAGLRDPFEEAVNRST